MSCRFGPSTAADQRVSTWTGRAEWLLHQESLMIIVYNKPWPNLLELEKKMVNRHPWSDQLQYLLKIECYRVTSPCQEIQEWMMINIDQVLEFPPLPLVCLWHRHNLTHGPIMSHPSELSTIGQWSFRAPCKAQEPHTLQELQGPCQVDGWDL